jgi:hypothetical protein
MAPQESVFAQLGHFIGLLAQLTVVAFACYAAFTIRTFAIDNYGRLIHECVAARARAQQGGCGAGPRRARGG